MGGKKKRNSGIGSLLAPLLPRVVCLPTYAALTVIWFSLRESNHAGWVLHGKWKEGKGREQERRGEGGVGGFVDGGSEGSMAWRKDNGGLVAAGLTWEFRGLFLFWDCSSNGNFCFYFFAANS